MKQPANNNANNAPRENINMLLSVQYLRGLAAMMIVYVHTQDQVAKLNSDFSLPSEFSGSGVDIFFIISGFIMWVTTSSSNLTFFEFINRRIERIVPLYWIITIFVGVLSLIYPSVFSSTKFDLNHFVSSLFFIPAPHPVLPYIYPIIIPGWTLNYEMFFYLLFGVTLFFQPITRFISIIFLLLIVVLVAPISQSGVITKFYSDPIILEFALGVTVGALFTSRFPIPPYAAIIILLTGIGLIVVADGLFMLRDVHRLLKWGCPAALIVLGAVMFERQRPIPVNNWLLTLGNASYSIYLTHFMTLAVTVRVIRILKLNVDGHGVILFSIAAFFLSAFVGYFVYINVEHPITKFFATKRRTSKNIMSRHSPVDP